MSERSVAEINAELDLLSGEFVAAAERWVREKSPEAFDAWRKAARRYQAVHHEWWALMMPEVDYDSVFGGVR